MPLKLHLITVTILLVSFSCSTTSSQSNRNQYGSQQSTETTIPPPVQPQISDNQQINIRNNAAPSNNNNRRFKRSYYPWRSNTYQTPQFDSISVWKPPVYQLSRPYYIPIFGAPGRIPIFFPPQPLLVNPGQPPKNPNSRYPTSTSGPPYLPPEKPKNGTTMPINNRNFEYDEDAPVWGVEPPPPPPASDGNSAGMVPTRAPPPSGPQTLPPLFHNVDDNNGGGGTNSLAMEEPSLSQQRTTTARPTTTTASAMGAAVGPQRSPISPGPCVWAIVSCCSAVSNQIRYNCFEQRGCVGAFWDASPCDSEFAKAAIASALNYYNSK